MGLHPWISKLLEHRSCEEPRLKNAVPGGVQPRTITRTLVQRGHLPNTVIFAACLRNAANHSSAYQQSLTKLEPLNAPYADDLFSLTPQFAPQGGPFRDKCLTKEGTSCEIEHFALLSDVHMAHMTIRSYYVPKATSGFSHT